MTSGLSWEDRVRKSVAEADRGELIDEDKVDAYFDARLAGQKAAKPR